MKKYAWRNTVKTVFNEPQYSVLGTVAVKTKEVNWLETESSSIILVSIHSDFHKPIDGDLKMQALMLTTKCHIKGSVTVLLADSAHIHAYSLLYHGHQQQAFEKCQEDAQKLSTRYQPYFKNCPVVHWHSFIARDPFFETCLLQIQDILDSDNIFQLLLERDAESTFISKHTQKSISKSIFLEEAKKDILAQCASLLVLSKREYRFLFYPGNPYPSTQYINSRLNAWNKSISWINTFVSIEKKVMIKYRDDIGISSS